MQAMLQRTVRHCIGSPSVSSRCCATILSSHRTIVKKTEDDEIKKHSRKVTKVVDRTPRSGVVIHRTRSFPATYDVERIMRALRACVEPRTEHEPVRVHLYCVKDQNKDIKDKFRHPSSQTVLPHPKFGARATVGLFTDGEFVEELAGEVDEVIQKNDFTQFFSGVREGNIDLCDCYVATPSMEIPLKRYGAVLKDKTPSMKRGLIAGNLEDMQRALTTARFLRRFEIDSNGVCVVDIGELDFSDRVISENIQHMVYQIKALVTEVLKDGEEPKTLLDYIVLSHGYTAFCVSLSALHI